MSFMHHLMAEIYELSKLINLATYASTFCRPHDPQARSKLGQMALFSRLVVTQLRMELDQSWYSQYW